MKTANDVVTELDLSKAQDSAPFYLRVGPVGVTVLCPDPLRSALVTYFAEALSDQPGEITVAPFAGATPVVRVRLGGLGARTGQDRAQGCLCRS